MIVTDIKIYKDLAFEDYLKTAGFSYSGIKNAGRDFGPPTEKMKLGTQVHNYLLEPSIYNYENHKVVRPLAEKVKETIGPLFKFLQKEIAFTANFTHAGFTMPYKGRIDLGARKRIIIDLKVTEKLDVNFFGYDNQLSGYAMAYEAPIALIITIHPLTLKTSVINIPIKKEWWEYQTIQYGRQCETIAKND